MVNNFGCTTLVEGFGPPFPQGPRTFYFEMGKKFLYIFAVRMVHVLAARSFTMNSIDCSMKNRKEQELHLPGLDEFHGRPRAISKSTMNFRLFFFASNT